MRPTFSVAKFSKSIHGRVSPGSLLVFPSYTIPENTFKDGIHSLTLDRNDIAIYIRIDHQVVLSVVQFEKS